MAENPLPLKTLSWAELGPWKDLKSSSLEIFGFGESKSSLSYLVPTHYETNMQFGALT